MGLSKFMVKMDEKARPVLSHSGRYRPRIALMARMECDFDPWYPCNPWSLAVCLLLGAQRAAEAVMGG